MNTDQIIIKRLTDTGFRRRATAGDIVWYAKINGVTTNGAKVAGRLEKLHRKGKVRKLRSWGEWEWAGWA